LAQTLPPAAIESIVGGYNTDPFAVLGPHIVEVNGEPALAVRAMLPWAAALKVVLRDGSAAVFDAWRIHPDGFFEAVIPQSALRNPGSAVSYTLRAIDPLGQSVDLLDTYSFGPLLSDFDLHLIAEGQHYRTYEKLGAHVRQVGDVQGVHFAVWAPNAQRVSVIGNFNNWDGRVHPMRFHPNAGIWEIFLPNVPAGEAYKYQIRSRVDGSIAEKADPYGFYAEFRPRTASIVFDIDRYQWDDANWMRERSRRQSLDAPIAIYEVHLGSWKRILGGGRSTTSDGTSSPNGGWLDYRQLAHELVDYVKYLGYTPVRWLVGLPDDRLLRVYLALRQPRRLPVLCGPLPP
jgi:1,4-alpha-glucan branching enzyme